MGLLKSSMLSECTKVFRSSGSEGDSHNADVLDLIEIQLGAVEEYIYSEPERVWGRVKYVVLLSIKSFSKNWCQFNLTVADYV